MIYLAGPYSDPSPVIMHERFVALTAWAAKLIHAGEVVYSPITHNHPIALRHGLPRGWEFWEKFDVTFLTIAKQMYIVTLPGWETSKGVDAESTIAARLKIPILLVAPL